MIIGSICSRDIVTVSDTAPLKEAARLMRDHHVGTVVVIESIAGGPHVRGLLTDRDLAVVVLARGLGGEDLSVGDLLVGAQRLQSVPQESDLGEAIALMQASGVRRLLVHDSHGHLVGIVSFDDLLRVCAAQLAGLAAVLAKGMEREVFSVAAETIGTIGEAPARPVPLPPRPVLRVPAMGTAGWPAAIGGQA